MHQSRLYKTQGQRRQIALGLIRRILLVVLNVMLTRIGRSAIIKLRKNDLLNNLKEVLKVILGIVMKQFHGRSLKTRLYLVVLAAFIPVSFLIFYFAEEQKAIETEAILQKAMLLARAAANEENQQLESTRNLLVAAADALLMVEGQAERLSSLMIHLVRRSKEYADFGIVDLKGRLLVSGDPSETGRDYSSKPWFTDRQMSAELTLGPYHGEHIHGEPVLYFSLPVTNSRRQFIGTVYAAVNLNWMNRTIFKRLAALPAGSQLILLDESQGMLRYDVDAGQWSIPDSFSPALLHEISHRQSGTLNMDDENGDKWIYAYTSLVNAYRKRRVSIVLKIPKEVALSASNHIFTRNVVLLVLSALMAVLALWWASNVFVLKRIRALVRASRELAAGDLGARVGKVGFRDELSHLAGVFDEMASSLQVRVEREEKVMTSLQQSREQFRRLAAYQQEVREQERIRIAREIHDQFGQSLTILKMDLSWLKKQLPDKTVRVEEKMNAMAGVIDETQKNLHAITAELRPAILDDFGLAAAMEWQIDELRNHSTIDFRMEKIGAEPDLPKDQATALFRIFQEILTNIMRHANADAAVVRLEASDEELILQVRDNGRGITENEINDPRSFGLLGIRERLHPWNGRVVIEGKPGLGTRITIYLPIPLKGEPK
jgi:signal transduction histidine kinase